MENQETRKADARAESNEGDAAAADVEMSPTNPCFDGFIDALKGRGKSFSEVCHSSDRVAVIHAAGISDPLDVASIETTWTKRIAADSPIPPVNQQLGSYGTFEELPTIMPEEGNANDDAADEVAEGKLALAYKLSWIVNIVLFLVKLGAAVASGSQVILAALVDSAVDLLSQAVISVTSRMMGEHSDEYPIGRNRLEAIGVVACAVIMSISSAFVIQSAGKELTEGLFDHKLPYMKMGAPIFATLVMGTVAKLLLWFFCKSVKQSDSMAALAEDHLNDVVSNGAAIIAAAIALSNREYWYVDSAGAIIISFWIIYRWWEMTNEQIGKLVGKTAPPAFIAKCNALASRHHPYMKVDLIRAYHLGACFAVEMEVVLPASMVLKETHDIALALQHKIEALEDCERAHVHVDYAFRDIPEHKVERSLQERKSS